MTREETSYSYVNFCGATLHEMEAIDEQALILREKAHDLYNYMVSIGYDEVRLRYESGVIFKCEMCPPENRL